MVFKKVIRASAGTGKTYQLSLEFINILLTFKDEINFEEILVITFTKKATAEIRERILSHLKNLIENTSEAEILWQNLEKLDSRNFCSEYNINILKNIYCKIVTHKNKLQISTIDSFTNSIFKGLISPFYNISDYSIDSEINEKYLPELFDEVLQKENINDFEKIFQLKKGRNLTPYNNLILDIIRFRWIFEYEQPEISDLEEIKKGYFQKYCLALKNLLDIFAEYFQSYLNEKKRKLDWQNFLKKEFYQFLTKYLNIDIIQFDEFIKKFHELITSMEIISENHKFLLKGEPFWNGSKLLRKTNDSILKCELLQLVEETTDLLANYLFYEKLLPEQENIQKLASIILKKYDIIKFRERIFTYDDISYYTYRFLHDPHLSLIDDNNILNIFYERLSNKIRFILIDEFQDTSILQWKIISPMISELISGFGQKEHGGVIIVGDEKQAIYGWRGGKRELLLKTPDFLRLESKVEILQTSYRSTETIVNFVNNFFGNSLLHEKLSLSGLNWEYDILKYLDSASTGFVEITFENIRPLDNISENRTEKREKAELFRDYIQKHLLNRIENNEIDLSQTAIIMRRNKDMESFASVLREFSIPYILESSNSIFSYHAIRPILYLMRFLAYLDIFEFVKFIRSDLILLPVFQMKKFLHELTTALKSAGLATFLQENNSDLFWQKISFILTTLNNKSLLEFCKTIIEIFEFTKIFSSEVEIKNIHYFLEIAADFEKNNVEFPHDLTGFLTFCRKNENSEEFSRLSTLESNSLRLLTIHKSKGLEFQNVYVFINLSGRKAYNNSGMTFYEKYDDLFSFCEEHLFTFNFNDVIKKSQKKYLPELQEKRKQIEELNNYYVALTRAKNNLLIFAVYDSAKTLDHFLNSTKIDKVNVSNDLFSCFHKQFCDKIINNSLIEDIFQYGEFVKNNFISNEMSDLEKQNYSKDLFGITSQNDLSKNEQQISDNIKEIRIAKDRILEGNIVHYYLSQIKYDSEEARKIAFQKTIAKFGTFITYERFTRISKQIDHFINFHKSIFDPDNWDRVFNEFLIFAENGQELRIDRLLINTRLKKILIIDYKTGQNYMIAQLETYKRALQNLKIVHDENYQIDYEFLQLEI